MPQKDDLKDACEHALATTEGVRGADTLKAQNIKYWPLAECNMCSF